MEFDADYHEELFDDASTLEYSESPAEKTNCESSDGRSKLEGTVNNHAYKCPVAGITVTVINGTCQAYSNQCEFAL